jgi:hypothetical protein
MDVLLYTSLGFFEPGLDAVQQGSTFYTKITVFLKLMHGFSFSPLNLIIFYLF